MKTNDLKKLEGDQEQWTKKITEAEAAYNYLPALTTRLDAHKGEFTEQTVFEIVLWKTNRYPEVDEEIIAGINALRAKYSEFDARVLLKKLLNKHGFDLAMSSTILRFACPQNLQMIDQRVYRLIMPGESYLKHSSNIEVKVELYFNYLHRLKEVCDQYGVPFEKADRILSELDKMENRDVAVKS